MPLHPLPTKIKRASRTGTNGNKRTQNGNKRKTNGNKHIGTNKWKQTNGNKHNTTQYNPMQTLNQTKSNSPDKKKPARVWCLMRSRGLASPPAPAKPGGASPSEFPSRFVESKRTGSPKHLGKLVKQATRKIPVVHQIETVALWTTTVYRDSHPHNYLVRLKGDFLVSQKWAQNPHCPQWSILPLGFIGRLLANDYNSRNPN